jgi:oligoribonuclease NrnB/cAMP/cGMP phosphodiesterase (DHH superfamily)
MRPAKKFRKNSASTEAPREKEEPKKNAAEKKARRILRRKGAPGGQRGETAVKCFHHIDFDGKLAGAIVKKACPDAELIPADYDIAFPFERIAADELVVLVDYSLKPDGFKRLLEITQAVIWIDHHKTAIEACNAAGLHGLPGLRKDGWPAGCMLAWQFFFDGAPAPRAVELVSDYDTWRYAFGQNTERFAAGLEAHDTSALGGIWPALLEDDGRMVQRICNDGDVVLAAKRERSREITKKSAFVCLVKGFRQYTVAAANVPLMNSKLWDDFQHKTDILCNFYMNRDLKWVVSLYSKTVDVSEIAKSYGGGGHRGAAGFMVEDVEDLPFEMEVV